MITLDKNMVLSIPSLPDKIITIVLNLMFYPQISGVGGPMRDNIAQLALFLVVDRGNLSLTKFFFNRPLDKDMSEELTKLSIKPSEYFTSIGLGNDMDILKTAIFLLAAAKNHVAIVKFFIEELKIDVNVQSDRNNTALIIAARNNSMETVEFLLKIPGINIQSSNIEGISPLIAATNQGFKNIVEALLTKSVHQSQPTISQTP